MTTIKIVIWKNLTVMPRMALCLILTLVAAGCTFVQPVTPSPAVAQTAAVGVSPTVYPSLVPSYNAAQEQKTLPAPVLTPALLTPTLTLPEPTPVVSPSAEQSLVEPQGWLIFSAYGYTTGSSEGLDISRANGLGWKNLLADGAHPQSPLWSPNGQWIAFNRFVSDGGEDLYVMRPDGTGIRRLTYTHEREGGFSWSQDSKKILYASSEIVSDPPKLELKGMFLLDVQTGSSQRVFESLGTEIVMPAYSPDGKKIAFLADSVFEHGFALMVMDVDGQHLQRLTEIPAAVSYSWSPDGQKIVFTSTDAEYCQDLYIVDVDGANLFRLTNDKGNESSPRWSSDGEWIAFAASPDCVEAGDGTPRLIRPDGSGLHKLNTPSQRYLYYGVWFPLPPLQTGQEFTITESGDALKLRAQPGLAAEVKLKLAQGTQILVIEGPVEMDDYLWWHIRLSGSQTEGWVAEIPGWFEGKW